MRQRGFPVRNPRGICQGVWGGWKQLVISPKTMLVPCPVGWLWKTKHLLSMHFQARGLYSCVIIIAGGRNQDLGRRGTKK